MWNVICQVQCIYHLFKEVENTMFGILLFKKRRREKSKVCSILQQAQKFLYHFFRHLSSQSFSCFCEELVLDVQGNLQFAEDAAEGAELPLKKFTPRCSLAKGTEIQPAAFRGWNFHGKPQTVTDGKSRDVM